MKEEGSRPMTRLEAMEVYLRARARYDAGLHEKGGMYWQEVVSAARCLVGVFERDEKERAVTHPHFPGGEVAREREIELVRLRFREKHLAIERDDLKAENERLLADLKQVSAQYRAQVAVSAAEMKKARERYQMKNEGGSVILIPGAAPDMFVARRLKKVENCFEVIEWGLVTETRR